MSKPLSYYVNLVNNANTENLPERLKRYREAYEYQNNSAKNAEGGTQSSTPLLPIRQQVPLAGPTNNQLSNAILMPNNVQVKANQAMIQQGLQPAYLGQAPTVTQPQPLPDPSMLQRIGSGATGVVKSMSATIPMFVDTAAQTLDNRYKDSQNHFYTSAYKEYQNLYNQVEAYKKQNPNSIKMIAKPDPTDPRGVRQITETEYTPELQALINAMKEKENFMNLQKDTTPVSSDSLGMEMYRDANKDKEYALQGLDATGRFIGSTLMSIGQNALTLPFATVNPALSLGMMSANAASDRMGELNEQRVSAGEALGRGLLSGGIEAVTEKVSLENLLNIAKTAPKSLKEAVVRTLKQSGAEASEEAVSYTLNALADYAANDPEAEFNIRGLLESAAGGALSGGLMGGGANLVGYAKGSNDVSFKDSKQAVTLPLGQGLNNTPSLNQNIQEEQINEHMPGEQIQIPQANKQMVKSIPLAPEYATQLVGQDTYNTLQQIAKKANTTVSIVQGKGYDGYYQDGGIYINVNSDKPVLTTMKHELTHHIETSAEYDTLMNIAKNVYGLTSKHGVQNTINNIREDYRNYGIDLSEMDGQHEFLAKFVEEKLFSDEASIKKLYQEQPNLFKRIYEWIKDSIKYVRSNREQRALMDMEKLYVKAMNDTAKNYVTDFSGNKVAYSINKTFSEQVDEVLNGSFDKSNLLYVSELPDKLKEVFGNNYPLLMTSKHVNTVYNDSGSSNANYHGLGELIKQVPDALKDPVMVINNPSKTSDSVIVVTELKDKLNNTIIVPIEVGVKGYYNDIQIDANQISTIFGKNNFGNFMDMITLNDILSINKEKAAELYKVQGRQLPNQLNNLNGFIHSVRKSNQKVNYQSDGNYMNNMQIALEQAGLLDSDGKSMMFKPKLEDRVSGDDLFDNEAHLRIPLDNKRKLDVSDYLSDIKPSIGKSLSDYDQMFNDDKAINLIVEPANSNDQTAVKTKQIQDSERRAFTQLSKSLQDTFGISRSDVNNELKNEVMKLKESLQTTGKIDSKVTDALFDKAWELGQTKDTTMYDLYPNLVTNLKEAGLDIDLAKKALGKTAYNDYRYEAKRLVGMQKDGRSIDSFYNELANTYPELFDETINNEADQLYAMLDVADELQPRNKSLKDTDANLYKEGYREDFHKALNDYFSKMERFQQIHGENIAKNTQKEPVSYEVYKATMDQMKNLERDYERVMRELFTQKEKAYAEDILKGKLDYTDIKNANVDNVRKIVEAKQPLDQARTIKQDYKKAIRQERFNTAKELIKSMPMWKEKKFGFGYSMETAERNIIDVVGDNGEAKAINGTLFEPIHISEAARNKFMNEYRSRIDNLNLTRKESEVVQRYGEGDMKVEDVVNAGFDLEKIQHAVDEFRVVYDELLSKMNEVLVKNGYNPVEARKDYFPHFVEQDNGILETIKRLLNPNSDIDNLGTSLAGITESFRPGKQFFANALERHSNKTVYDAVRGFDNYINGVSNVIFHTDNIQNLRAFEETIRYQNSDDGLKAKIDEINNDGDLSEDERQSRISEMFRDREKTTKFGDFVSWLNRYTNDLAGKKSVEDRTWEYNMGRGMYRLSKNLSNRVAGNMVAVNPSSWVTNFIPIAQATGECSPQNISKAMYDVVTNKVISDNFNSRSTFMTNRIGSENLYKTDMQKIVDKLSSPMQMIDSITSEVVTRAKYYENLDKGMSDTEAMKNADAYAAGLIADRSKGAMPTLFNIKNPITKAFTQFQLEQNNQLRYLFKDLPRAKKDEAMKALLIALFNIATSSWLFNNVYEAFFGRRPALDPIDMAFDAWGVLNDPELKNSEKAATILSDVGGELPFIGNLTGGGRLPIAGALPKWDDLPKVLDIMDPEIDDRKKQDILYKTIIKPGSYWVLPFGAGQLNKTGSGLHDYAQGAAYQYTDDGDKLKYTIDQNPLNLARAFIGGSSSFPEAQNYWEGDYKTLSVKDTDTFQMLKDEMGNKTALEKVYELKAIESLKNANGGTIKYSKAILTRDYIDGLPLNEAEKKDLYKKYIVNEDIRDADSAAYRIYREKFEKELEGKK